MQEDDADYYRRRADIETRLAQRTAEPRAIAAHQQLATMYLERLTRCQVPEAAFSG